MKTKALIFYDQLQLATKRGSDYGPVPLGCGLWWVSMTRPTLRSSKLRRSSELLLSIGELGVRDKAFGLRHHGVDQRVGANAVDDLAFDTHLA